MELINESGLSVVWVVGKIKPPEWSITFIVKGTYKLKRGGIATLTEEQEDPTGDEHQDDDFEKTLNYPSDFAYFKPRADLLLKGTCFPQKGRAVAATQVTFQVGACSKTLAIIGDRTWSLLRGVSDPAPFSQMPLNYEYAFGGKEFPKNPLGKGYEKVITQNEKQIRPFPNIEFPDRLIKNPNAEHEPAGFGPIPQMWPQRMKKVGTFGKKWLKERWPWYPEDFDWGYFNCAPGDQQIEGYLQGDEALFFENLHPDVPHYHCQLPGIRVHVFLNELVRAKLVLREVPMNLDTLWVDMDAEKLVLVWRGIATVRSEKLDEFNHFFVYSQAMHEPAHSLNRVRALLFDAIEKIRREEEEDFELEDEEEEESELLQAGIDVAEEEDQGEEEDLEIEETDEDEDSQSTVQLEESGNEALPLSSHFPSNQSDMPLLGETSEVEVKSTTTSPQEMAVELELESEKDQQEIESMQDALRQKGKEVPEALLALIATPPTMVEDETEDDEETELEEIPDEPEPLNHEEILDRISRKETLEGQDLSEMDLSAMDLSHMNLREAILQGAILIRANLNQADLTGASLGLSNLREADCQATNFSEADLTEVSFMGANLAGASLQGADLTMAGLRGANLFGIQGEGAIFEGADLSRADLQTANLSDADLTECRMHGTNFSKANLERATLENAWGRGVVGDEATLTKVKAAGGNFCEGSFKNIQGHESVWEGGQLYGCDFSGSNLKKAEFSSCYLGSAKFNKTDLREACFDEAMLMNAKMIRVNLFGASLEKTNLTGVDLRESNLYEADLWDTVLECTNLEGANIRMTKLVMEA